jgi:diguanylate cyclase (GGDEF)-like protein
MLVVIYTTRPQLLGRRYMLERSPVGIGSDADNEIVLEGEGASPRHAHLEERDSAWWCVDDGSASGVYIDDRRISAPARLTTGARIGVGSTILKFLAGRDAEAQYHQEIYQMTIIDGLTQVHVRRYLLEALDKEFMRARRKNLALGLLMIEGDGQGDDGMRELAGLLRPLMRRDWVLARDEARRFALLLSEHDLDEARAEAERLREKIAASPLTLRVGIGVAVLRDDDRSSLDLIGRAITALQVARGQGPNQVA